MYSTDSWHTSLRPFTIHVQTIYASLSYPSTADVNLSAEVWVTPLFFSSMSYKIINKYFVKIVFIKYRYFSNMFLQKIFAAIFNNTWLITHIAFWEISETYSEPSPIWGAPQLMRIPYSRAYCSHELWGTFIVETRLRLWLSIVSSGSWD